MNKQLRFSGKQYHDHIKFWQDQRSAASSGFVLKGNRTTKDQHPDYQEEKFPLTNENHALLEKYTGSRDLEGFVMLLSALSALLVRYGNGPDIILHTPLLSTQPSDTVFEWRVPLILRAEPALKARDMLREVNAIVLKSYQYQNVPFDVLPVNTSFPASNILLYSEALHTSPAAEDLRRYDLVIRVVREAGHRISFVFRYNAGSFDSWFIHNMVKHYNEVISAFHNLDQPIASMNWMPGKERLRLVVERNRTGWDYPQEKTVVALFREHATRSPENMAVIFGDIRLKYRELDEQSDRLAYHLWHDHKIKRGDCIAVVLEKSHHSIISLLAIWKAGAVYVPVDPLYPAARIDYMLSDVNAAVVITHTEHLFNLTNYKGVVLALDVQQEVLATGMLKPDIEPEVNDIAYIIYTSGSTGNPKGVLIEHGGLVNVSLDHVRQLKMSSADVYLQFMALSFDGSLLDIFTALLSGAALALPEKAIVNDVQAFINYVAQHRITVFTVTPSYLSALNHHEMPSVRTLVSAGEAARADDAFYYAGFKDFYNGYGPSEVTVNATLYKVQAGREYATIPIGTPSANKKIYLVDADMALVPEGIPGEICIAGNGLARGYLNDDVLTLQKFVDNPFETGTRLYKTGDLGKWTGEGQLEFVGRKDEQVKLNGFRADIGEIENILLKHPGIMDGAVVPLKNETGSVTLAGFYTERKLPEIVPSLGEYGIYDPFIYQAMATDEMRVSGYRRALTDTVKDKIVLDPGTGHELILARHCVAAGARKVYAVEIDADAFEKARENLRKYKLEDKVVLIKGDASEIVYPEAIDCCVSALAGNIASSDGCHMIVNKLKAQLPPSVTFIPGQYQTKIAAVSLSNEAIVFGFSDVSAHYSEQVFKKIGYPFDLRTCLRYFPKTSVLSNEAVCEEIDYSDALSPESSSTIALKVLKHGRISGFALWIQAFFGEQIILDSLEETHHLPVYFPVFDEAEQVSPGDVIEGRFSRTLSDNGLNPDYLLEGSIVRKDGTVTPFEYYSYNHRELFRSNEFYRKLFNHSAVAQPLGGLSEMVVKRYLEKYLPQHMIPGRLIQLKTMPFTENGKIDKKALTKILETADARKVHVEAPRNAIEELLIDIWESVLGRKPLGIYNDFFTEGGDSIKAIQVASRMHKAGYKIEVKHVFENPMIADLAMYVKSLIKVADQSPVVGQIPLTPIQYELMPLDRPDPHHFNQAVMLQIASTFDEPVVRAIFTKIYEHHDALRITLQHVNGAWRQYNHDVDHRFSLEVVDLRGQPHAIELMDKMAQRMQSTIDLADGPLMKLALFRLDNDNRLLIVIHHLVIDGISWRILFEDIDTLYRQYTRKEKLALPLKTDGFKTWAEKLLVYASSEALLLERDHWLGITNAKVPVIPLDFKEPDNKHGDLVGMSFSLRPEDTQLLLTQVNQAFRTDMNDILLSALALSIGNLYGHDRILVTLEGHGREEVLNGVDITRTVGWFSVAYPVLLPISPADDLPTLIMDVKNVMREVPKKGIGYGILKYLSPPVLQKGINFRHPAQVSFNYLGQFDSDLEMTSFQIAKESPGNTQSERAPRIFDLEVSGMIAGGQLVMSVSYNHKRFRNETVQKILKTYEASLLAIMAYCTSQATAQDDPAFSNVTTDDLNVINTLFN